MKIELKLEIIKWLAENENRWQRVINCIEAFRMYIYDSKGGYLIGGEEISDFITEANRLLYP